MVEKLSRFFIQTISAVSVKLLARYKIILKAEMSELVTYIFRCNKQ